MSNSSSCVHTHTAQMLKAIAFPYPKHIKCISTKPLFHFFHSLNLAPTLTRRMLMGDNVIRADSNEFEMAFIYFISFHIWFILSFAFLMSILVQKECHVTSKWFRTLICTAVNCFILTIFPLIVVSLLCYTFLFKFCWIFLRFLLLCMFVRSFLTFSFFVLPAS